MWSLMFLLMELLTNFNRVMWEIRLVLVMMMPPLDRWLHQCPAKLSGMSYCCLSVVLFFFLVSIVKSWNFSISNYNNNNNNDNNNSVVAKVGDELEKGDPVLILEAMKMEHVIRAPKAGIVESINFGVDDLVDEKVTLAVVTTKD